MSVTFSFSRLFHLVAKSGRTMFLLIWNVIMCATWTLGECLASWIKVLLCGRSVWTKYGLYLMYKVQQNKREFMKKCIYIYIYKCKMYFGLTFVSFYYLEPPSFPPEPPRILWIDEQMHTNINCGLVLLMYQLLSSNTPPPPILWVIYI